MQSTRELGRPKAGSQALNRFSHDEGATSYSCRRVRETASGDLPEKRRETGGHYVMLVELKRRRGGKANGMVWKKEAEKKGKVGADLP